MTTRPTRRTAAAAAITLASFTSVTSVAQTHERGPVAATPYFAFYSDFATNVNDALIAAGAARQSGQRELFQSGPEQACYDALPAAERAGWSRAVDYYAEIVSPAGAFDRAQILLRLELMEGTAEWAEGGERRSIEIARGLRAAAAPAYERCRWSAQNAGNRRWIDTVLALLERHEAAIANRLAMLYDTDWEGLPFAVDVVEAAGWSGADSVLLEPPGVHIRISSSNTANEDRAALEVVFHEASHFLMGRGAPVRAAIDRAMSGRGMRGGDLWHTVLFFMTGEVVRERLESVGDPSYEPYMYAQDVFARVHGALERTWPRYMAGERTLDAAAEDLVLALAPPSP